MDKDWAQRAMEKERIKCLLRLHTLILYQECRCRVSINLLKFKMQGLRSSQAFNLCRGPI